MAYEITYRKVLLIGVIIGVLIGFALGICFMFYLDYYLLPKMMPLPPLKSPHQGKPPPKQMTFKSLPNEFRVCYYSSSFLHLGEG